LPTDSKPDSSYLPDERLRSKLAQAEVIIGVQGKSARALGGDLEERGPRRRHLNAIRSAGGVAVGGGWGPAETP
jgi:hypothetical protein